MQRLRQLREARGLTQARLAEMVGCDQSQISKIERGSKEISLGRIYEIAAALNVEPSELFEPNESRLGRLAMRGDVSPQAVGIRLAASLRALGMTQAQLGQLTGRRPSAIGNAIAGKNYPSIEALRALHTMHGIDYNFSLAGETGGLPHEVQSRLLYALEAVQAKRTPDAAGVPVPCGQASGSKT